MKLLTDLSDSFIPAILFLVVGWGMLSGVNTYETFLKGAKEGLTIVLEILPTLMGLMVGVGVLRSSGFLQLTGNVFAPAMKAVGLPGEILPLLVIKLFSSSAATGLVLDLFRNYGPDSYIGFLTSLIMSCTETCFYTMSVYFMAAKVTKTRYTLVGALLATFAGTLAAILLAGFVRSVP